MEDRKAMFELSYSLELPSVDHRKFELHQSRKIATMQRKIQTTNKNQTRHIKTQYIKLCNQIKAVYKLTENKKKYKNQDQFQTQFNDEEIKICNQVTALDRLLTKEKSCNKIGLCMKMIDVVKRNATQPSQLETRTRVIKKQEQILEVTGNSAHRSFSPLHLQMKFNKRLKPIPNSITKNVDTQELNISKYKFSKKKSRQILSMSKDVVVRSRAQTIMNHENKETKYIQNPESMNIEVENMREIHTIPIKTNREVVSKVQMSQKIGISETKTKFIKNKSLFKPSTNLSMVRERNFKVPFPTYYYRDLIWKINFSNQTIIETPLQYQHRLRVYIGKGNNAGLIRGLLKRRIWFAVTDKIEQANFVWTQIKNLSYFKIQNSKRKIVQKDLTLTGTTQQITSSKKCLGKKLQLGILTDKQQKVFKSFLKSNMGGEERTDERLQFRNKHFLALVTKLSKQSQTDNKNQRGLEDQQLKFTSILKSVSEIKQQKMHNHLINNYVIGNKKALLKIMTLYYKIKDDYVFNYLPYTFHVEKGLEDQNYFRFLKYYNQRAKQSKGNQEQNMWIVKPGQFSNRGNGIKVCKTLEDVKNILKTKQKHADGSPKTFIVQSYIQKPLLYNKRKFDLRHYMMITSVNGILKGYWYRQGYVRTTSSEFTLSTKDGAVHLTNDAVQKMLPEYGKFEKGNKIGYEQLNAYLSRVYGYKNFKFKQIIIPKMKIITTDIIKACSASIDPQLHTNNFQIFGMDFMIDSDFNLWLIEVNSNPCLELSCPLLSKLIPTMVENALELTIDAAFPPPVRYTPKGVQYLKKLQQQNKFDLVYDSRIDNFEQLDINTVIDSKMLNEEQQTYEDQGIQWNQDD